MSLLLKELDVSEDYCLQLVVTGMHLSPEFGSTYNLIESDGFSIAKKIEMLLSSDTDIGVAKSMGVGVLSFADAFAELEPDILICSGDRYEMFVAASVATVLKIPIVHLYGGETTEGAFDEAFRHSITKMSVLHFTSTEVYRNRVIQLGEHPDRVYNVGGIGIDNINQLELLDRESFQKSINFQLNKRNLLVTFHPTTLDNSNLASEQFGNLLKVLSGMIDTNIIFTKANADTDGRIINSMIDDYVKNNCATSISFISMGQLRYLSAMQYVDGVVGNSSSGLLEAPSFHIGTVNIGDRQKGRIRADSVIDCENTIDDITQAISILYSDTFQKSLIHVINPHGTGGATKKIINILRMYKSGLNIKKTFFDLYDADRTGR